MSKRVFDKITLFIDKDGHFILNKIKSLVGKLEVVEWMKVKDGKAMYLREYFGYMPFIHIDKDDGFGIYVDSKGFIRSTLKLHETYVECDPHDVMDKITTEEMFTEDVRTERLREKREDSSIIKDFNIENFTLPAENCGYDISVLDSNDNNGVTINDKNKIKGEENNMKKGIGVSFGGGFGEVKDDRFKMSPFGGTAIRTENGEYLAYNKKTKDLSNIGEMIMDFGMFMKMPVLVKQIKEGDIIIHKGNPLFVSEKVSKREVKCIDPEREEVVTVKPSKIMMMDGFLTKILNPMSDMGLMDTDSNSGSGQGMMGGMNPMMMMMAMSNKGEEKSGGIMEMMMMQNMMKNMQSLDEDEK